MKETACDIRWVEDAVDLYLAREQADALKSYLDRGRKLRKRLPRSILKSSRRGQSTCTGVQMWQMFTPNTNCVDGSR
jgi:hypothetical protein